MQHGQIFELKTTGPGGRRLWAYRYRLDGRGSQRIQRGGYANADNAREAHQRALTAAQRRKGRVRVTFADLAEKYLAQHDGQPETTAKLRWLLTKSTAAFGSTPLTELDARNHGNVLRRLQIVDYVRCADASDALDALDASDGSDTRVTRLRA